MKTLKKFSCFFGLLDDVIGRWINCQKVEVRSGFSYLDVDIKGGA